MSLIKNNKDLNRELRLIKSILKVIEKQSVSGSYTGKKLQEKGFVNSKGRITSKG